MQFGMRARRKPKSFNKSKPETIDLVLSETEVKWIVNAHAKPARVKVGEWLLWRFLGQGASGAVWEAYEQTKNGKSKKWSRPFALKLLFAKEDDETHNVGDEIEAWKRLKRGVEVHTLNKKTWLQMPLYSSLPTNIADDMVRDELGLLASSGVRHRDMEWRHVLYDDSCDEVRVVDFGCCELFDPSDERAVEESKREMWRELLDSRNDHA
jgi:hypothetical protein